MIYFSHPISDFNTEIEQVVERYIRDFFQEEVENPNQSKHQIGYQRYGMDYYKGVIDQMDKCVYMRMPSGKIGAGVAKEIKQFFEQGKPVYEFNRVTLELDEVLEMPDTSQVLSIDETRAEVKQLLKGK
jgi:hypothetical protein